MELLDQAGIARTLDDWHLTIGGHAEASWTWNFHDPDSDVNPGRVFDFEHNDITFNQLSLFIERKVDPAKKNFDVGGKVEAIFGADSGLIHGNGLTDWYDGPRNPENQLDLTQLYVDFAVPVGNGLLVRVGKFVTLLNQETIDPEGNSLFSHSFLFAFSAPFTQTGILASYNLTDEWSITGGITRGWDQAFEDNNSAIDFLGQVKWAMSKDTTMLLTSALAPNAPTIAMIIVTCWTLWPRTPSAISWRLRSTPISAGKTTPLSMATPPIGGVSSATVATSSPTCSPSMDALNGSMTMMAHAPASPTSTSTSSRSV